MRIKAFKSLKNSIVAFTSGKRDILLFFKQKKRLSVVLILLIGLICGLVLVQQVQELRERALTGGPNIYFGAPQIKVTPGSTGNTYDIFINTNDFDVSAVAIEISFNSSDIQITNIEKGNEFPVVFFSNVGSNTASLTLGRQPTNPPSPFRGTGKLASITFNAGSLEKTTDISFTQNTKVAAFGYTENVIEAATSGTVVIEYPVTPTPISTPTPTTTPVITNPPSFTPGDIDQDGDVDIIDFQLLNNAFGSNDTAADINSDGTVNVLDFQLLSNNFGK